MLASTTMNILKVHGCYSLQLPISYLPKNVHSTFASTYHKHKLPHVSSTSVLPFYPQYPISRTNSSLKSVRVSKIEAPLWTQIDDDEEFSGSSDDLTMNGEAYQKTLRLVVCSMFAALGGLAYVLSSSLAIELMHGFLGLTMGSLWRLKAGWGVSVFVSAVVRATGAMGYVVMYSFLIRENILALITINIHASATFILSSLGSLAIPISINEYNLCPFWYLAFTELLFLCVLATSSICPFLYKAWNEIFPETAKLVR